MRDGPFANTMEGPVSSALVGPGAEYPAVDGLEIQNFCGLVLKV